jgi:anti-anti-sigma factor
MSADANVVEVRRLWKVWQRDGIEALTESVPDDVEWQPYSAGGRRLSSTRELRDFFTNRVDEVLTAELFDVEAVEPDAVIATGVLRRETARATSATQVAWLYCFEHGRLRRASGHSSSAEARESARLQDLIRHMTGRGMQQPFSIAISSENDRTVLAPRGELDAISAPHLMEALLRAAEAGTPMVIDLSGVPFMDSRGLRCLLDAVRASRTGAWELAVRPGPESVRRVIALAGADRLLPLEHAA